MNMKKRTLKIILIGMLIAFLLMIGIALLLRVTEIEAEGNSYYSEEELTDLIFTKPLSRSPLMILIDNRRGRPDIPFVENYSVRLTGLRSIRIHVQEKRMAGYISFLDSNLYFDWDGLVIESSKAVYPDVPLVTGLNIDQVVLGQTLPLGGDIRNSGLLQVSQFLSENEITWHGQKVILNEITDRIHFDGNSDLYCVFGDLAVKLGDAVGIESKLKQMRAILPELEDRSGTLHLESYQSTNTDQSYWFEKN